MTRRRTAVTLHGVAARKPPPTRLSVEDWLQAGYALLASVTKAYGDYGFSPADAPRAELTYAAGIGLLQLAATA